jgi:hypothetical protein
MKSLQARIVQLLLVGFCSLTLSGFAQQSLEPFDAGVQSKSKREGIAAGKYIMIAYTATTNEDEFNAFKDVVINYEGVTEVPVKSERQPVLLLQIIPNGNFPTDAFMQKMKRINTMETKLISSENLNSELAAYGASLINTNTSGTGSNSK